jgi:hypothetical protein
MFFNQYPYFAASNGGQNMAKSKKAKSEGREQHRQTLRAKKMAKKQKKMAALPTRHQKNKR